MAQRTLIDARTHLKVHEQVPNGVFLLLLCRLGNLRQQVCAVRLESFSQLVLLGLCLAIQTRLQVTKPCFQLPAPTPSVSRGPDIRSHVCTHLQQALASQVDELVLVVVLRVFVQS